MTDPTTTPPLRETVGEVFPAGTSGSGPDRAGSTPAAHTFDPWIARARSLRAAYIASGAIVPLSSRPTLRMDERGHRVARRHAESGDHGRKILPVAPGFFELAAWHVRAIEARERRVAEFNAFLKRVWPPAPMPSQAIATALAKQTPSNSRGHASA